MTLTLILSFNEILDQPVGGKALGLAQLQRAGLQVPNGFVLTAPHTVTKAWLKPHLEALGPGPKAVRSSALGEDGAEASFAGQYESILNCHTLDDIIDAIERCTSSVDSQRAQAYAHQQGQEPEQQMCVIVQHMVDAKVAGVLFTADPVQNRRDTVVLDATEGLGEALVSGQVSGHHYRYLKAGPPPAGDDLLSQNQLLQLRAEALVAECCFGRPLDLEWAIDQAGQLHWLQARPITTLSPVHLNELDTHLAPNEALTRGNIGEMMPGPVTPLTYSVFGRAIELGLQDFYVACGAQPAFTQKWLYIKMHYQHLFLSLTAMYEMCATVLLAHKDNIDLSVVGQIVAETRGPAPGPWWRRAWNQWKQIRYLNRAPKQLKRLRQLCHTFDVALTEDPLRQYDLLGSSHESLNQAYAMHYNTSAQSGSLHAALLGIISGGKLPPTHQHHSDAASLLIGIEDIEGVDAVAAIERIAAQLQADPSWRAAFQATDTTAATLLAQLQASDDAAAKSFRQFLLVHGHRCVREAELSERDWSQDPSQVVQILKQQLRQTHQTPTSPAHPPQQEQERLRRVQRKLPWFPRLLLPLLLPKVRQAVTRREASKSLCIKLQQRIKQGYLHLGQLLVDRGLLPQDTAIFFLTHQEIGLLLADKAAHWHTTIAARKDCYEAAQELHFDDVYVGVPYPATEAPDTNLPVAGTLQGLPVSPGIVEGRVRIIRTLEQASTLEQGDIMICRFTDVGWTPFFSTIGGLVTEIGSPLSHGAVVAREYGIPAVVSMKGAMQQLSDGAQMRLDGTNGTITPTKVLG